MFRVPVLRRCVSCGLKNLVLPDRPAACLDCGSKLVSVTPVAGSLRERVLRSTTVLPLPVGGELLERRLFYCQNPAQSGDTTGVGVALTLFPATSLLFCVSANEVAKAVDFLKFYADLGVRPERIVLVVGDARISTEQEREARVALDELVQSLDEKQRLLDIGSAQSEKERIREWRKAAKAKTVKASPTVAQGLLGNDLEAALASRRERDLELQELRESSSLRLENVKALLGARLELRDESEKRRSELKRRALVFAQHALSRYVGVVVPWEHLSARAGNQIYQDLLNLGVRTNANSNLRGSYKSLFDLENASFADIGQSTRDVARYLETEKLESTVQAVRNRFSTSLGDVDVFVQKFCKRLIDAQPKLRLGSLRPTLILIWVRGLNKTEKDSITTSGISPLAVGDKLQARLDTFKRNPQHVTTVQLYETIRLAVRHLNNRKVHGINHQRWLIPVPIGDELLLDWYDTKASPKANLYEGQTATNLIRFWTHVQRFAGSRFAQMYFLHRLTHSIDTIQLGIRSGAMEQGMYMGVPTIYFEERDSPSGARMAALARDLDVNTPFQSQSHASATRLPFFFRLQTKHLIGLNQARSRKNVEALIKAIESDGVVDERVARGTLTDLELAALEHGLAGICRQLAAYQLALQ